MSKKTTKTPPKKEYQKPAMTSDELMSFGALCNGVGGSGRKSTTSMPSNCQTAKLKS